MFEKLFARKSDQTAVSAMIPLDVIEFNPFQSRTDYGDIEELAERIRQARPQYPDTLGLMQVPHARVTSGNGHALESLPDPADITPGSGYQVQLLYGHRRMMAWRSLAFGDGDYAKMPLNLILADDDQMIDAVWSENADRRDLSAVEEAALIKWALEEFQCSQRELAGRWGMSQPKIANRLALLNLPEEIKDANRRGDLSERQCAALLPAVKALELAGDDIKWSTKVNGPDAGNLTHYAPWSPRAFMDYMISEEGRGMGSQRIRKYVTLIVEWATLHLPQDIANQEFEETGPFVQAACRGCQYRTNNLCYNHDCRDAKLSIWGVQQARAAAAQHDLPYSDNPGHFIPWLSKQDIIRHLFNSRQDGGCQHLVIGYTDAVIPRDKSGTVQRPGEQTGDYYYGHSYHRKPDINPTVMLGCTHGPGAACVPSKSVVDALEQEQRKEELMDSDPLEAIRPEMEAEWKRQAAMIKRHASAALREKFSDFYRTIDSRGYEMLLELLGKGGYEYDDHEKAIGDIWKILWAKASILPFDGDACAYHQGVAAALGRYGLKMPEMTARDQAVRVLYDWTERRSWNLKDDAADIRDHVAAAQDAIRYGDGDDLARFLALVAVEVEQALAAADEEEEE